jgi:hypothetical protein
MRINGEWYPCDDGIVRPVVHGEVKTGDGKWYPVTFLVDSGADQTMFAPNVLDNLRHTIEPSAFSAQGIGGRLEIGLITTSIQFHCDCGIEASFHGDYAALTQLGSLDMSVLGRDILSLFTVILDRKNNIVALINQRHEYSIVER